MADGKTANLAGLGLTALAASSLGHPLDHPHGLAFAGAYLIGTFWFTPGLDLAHRQTVEAKKNWGFVWIPYSLLFSHRGWSPSWLLGPLTRLVYVSPLLGLLWWEPWFELPLAYVVPALFGYYGSQWAHLVMDNLWPNHDWNLARKMFGGLR